MTVILEQYNRWADLLAEGYESGRTVISMARFKNNFTNVAICGMGGSGISGDFLAVLSQFYGGRVPIQVFKDFGIPPLHSGYLVIAVSYSGNTIEAVECSRSARKQGLNVAYVSSGGLLGEEAEESGSPWVKLEAGLLPRAALPLMVGALAGVTDQLGLTSFGEEVFLEAFYTLRNTLLDEARPIADAIADLEVLTVGACGYYGVLGERLRGEFSENSKMLVKTEKYPEAAHNDIMAWQTRKNVKLGFIAIKGGSTICDAIMDFVIGKYKLHGAVNEIILGPPTLANMMRGALIGGYASILAAQKRGVDPASTPIIDEYKRVLKTSLS